MSLATQAGGWGEWVDQTSCSAKCGGGFKRRSRACNNPYPVGAEVG